MQRITFYTIFIISFLASPVFAASAIGNIKVFTGQATVERSGGPIPAKLDMPIYSDDTITTHSNASLGLLFSDDTRLSLGANSTINIENYNFDKKSHKGNFDVAMHRGILSVISGKLTARRAGSLKVRTPSAILAVRGTEFSVKVDATEEIK